MHGALLSALVAVSLAGACGAAERAAESPADEAPCPRAAEARRVVERFLEARAAGSGAERWVRAEALSGFNESWKRGGLGLHPLYAPRRERYEDGEVAFAERLRGEGCSYEVGYRLGSGEARFGETLFVVRAGGRLEIVGGRIGLQGP